MSTKFFTNLEENTLFKKFEGVLANIPNIHNFDVLVGYFRASGYFKLRPYLNNIPQIRILAGINVDQISEKYYSAGQQFFSDPQETKDAFTERLKKDIAIAEYDNETEQGIFQFIEDIVSGKIKIKAHPDKKLHAKIYIFKPENFNQYSTGSVITGSSNFSKSGFGLTKNPTYEFNVELRDYDDVKFASDEFDKLWDEAIDILPVDVTKIKDETYLNDSFTPFELYIKLLIEYFGRRIDYDPANVDLLLPDSYMRLTYQAEAAIEGYEKLMRYNGFFLADVVGLGKTIIASIIAKKFVYENGYHSKILVVYPPALEGNWKRTIKDFHIWNNVYFVSTGSLHKVIDGKNLDYPNPNEYDLIIIDEAHKFRNDTSQMYEKLQTITKTDRSTSGTNGDVRKKIMLLSATPLNNHPSDIENQVYLFQDKRNSNLPTIKDLQSFFAPLKEEYDNLKKEKVLDVKKVKLIFDKIRDKVVEPLVIRRTRKDIENNKEYLKDLEIQGIKFPKINPPNKVEYEFDDNLSKLFDLTITYLTGFDEDGKETNSIGYYRYRAIEFLLKKEDRERYGDVESISKRLSAIMKTLLVKRLESSFYAFKMSLDRFHNNTKHMIKMFEDDTIYIAPDIDVNKYLNEGDEEGLEKKINEKGGNNLIYKKDDFKDDFLALLKLDLEYIKYLVDAWSKIEYDPKLDKFLNDIKKVFLNKKFNHSGKLVIFSESKETIGYLENHLNKNGYDKTLSISAANRKDKEETIRLNFDANLEKKEWETKYDLILTTEVLAEGINLHRSNVIINYDVPWNSTRLMQRIGRVNRIGTEANYINIYNFYPSDKSENQIKLTNTALKKLQAFHTAFGEDSQIYSQLEEVGEAGLYGSKLKEEVNETLVFLQELREFKKYNPKHFNEIKEIPQKARLARNANQVKVKDLLDCSISYLKSDDQPGVFYVTDKHGIVHEISFVEAAKIFKAKESEDSEKILPQEHHSQINKALEHFKQVSKLNEAKKVTKSELSPAEKRILPKIEFYLMHTKNEFYKKILKRTIDEIYKGSLKQLPNSIDKYFKDSKKSGVNDPEIVLDNLYNKVLKGFNFNEDASKGSSTTLRYSKPKIVISESFV
jgi:superfamily II DNA or RNA helicase